MQYLVDNHTQRAVISGTWKKTPNRNSAQFTDFCSPLPVAGRLDLLQVGARQEKLQDSIKILHNSDKLEDCSEINRTQFGLKGTLRQD